MDMCKIGFTSLHQIECSAADYFHHLLFVGVLCPFGLVCDWGVLQNSVAFFLCGLPGGEYFDCQSMTFELLTSNVSVVNSLTFLLLG